MLIHLEIRRFLYHLDYIVRSNRRKYSTCRSFMLYRTMIDFMRYWRQIQHSDFHRLSHSAQDELYYFFTEKLLHLFDANLDFYWLILDLDGEPLFQDCREPGRFWQKRARHPDLALPRFSHIY